VFSPYILSCTTHAINQKHAVRTAKEVVYVLMKLPYTWQLASSLEQFPWSDIAV